MTLKLYKSYMFRNKDPVIDKLRTVIKDENENYENISAKSGVTVSTMMQWFHGNTKRPQFATVMAVARALGYDLELLKQGKDKKDGD
jgi:transcriptional regulator with XRE-family HTH domain